MPRNFRNVKDRLPDELSSKIDKNKFRGGYAVHHIDSVTDQPIASYDSVECRICGAIIQSYRPDSCRTPIVRKVGGTRIIEYSASLRPTPLYTEVVLEMSEEDGRQSLHVTPLCKDCVGHVTVEDASALFISDIEQWAIDDEVIGCDKEQTRSYTTRQFKRRVTGVRR